LIVAVEAFRIDVFVIVDCKVGMVPEVACKLSIVAVDTFRTDVFVVVDCKPIKVPCDTFKTEVFVVFAFIVSIVAKEALKTDTFEVNDKIALLINVFTHEVVGIFVELSKLGIEDVIFGFIKKVVGVFIVKTDDRFPEPIFTVPVEPIFNSEVSDMAVISFAYVIETFNTEIFALDAFILEALVVPSITVEVRSVPSRNFPSVNSLPIIKSADGTDGSIVFVLKLFTNILVESI